MRNLTLRVASDNDRNFVEEVYFETQRWLIERLFGWRGDDLEKRKFAQVYDQANSRIISTDGVDVGWLTVVRNEDAWELEGIYLRVSHQRKGLGTDLIRQLLDDATLASVPLRLSTAKINPARYLYARMGFQEVYEDEFKVYMEGKAGQCSR